MNRLEHFDVFAIPLAEIFYDEEFNCRHEFTLESVRELADSIHDDGLKFPIVVQPAADVPGIEPGFLYRLVAGHRRLKAVKFHLAWNTIPSRIAAGLSVKQAAKFNLLENIERNDLNYLEEALAIQKQFPHATDRECAAEVHRSTRWVTQRRMVLRQPEEVQLMVASGRLSLNIIQTHIQPIHGKVAKIKMARRLCEDENLREINREYRMQTRPRSRKEINAKIALMLELGIHETAPIVTRFAAWCARGINDVELDRDLAKFANQNRG